MKPTVGQELKGAAQDRANLALRTSEAIDNLVAMLTNLQAASRTLRADLALGEARTEGLRYLSGDTTDLAVTQLLAGLGRGPKTPTNLADAVARETVAIDAAIDVAVRNHGVKPVAGTWSGTGASGVGPKTYTNMK